MTVHALMFGWEYPPIHLGGLGVACQGIVRGLLQNSVKVTLALPHGKGEEEGTEIVHPGTVHVTDMKTIVVPSLLQPYDTPHAYLERWEELGVHEPQFGEIYGEDLPAAVARFTASSVAMTQHTTPDLVHCHDWMTYEAGIAAAHHHRTPLVAHIHATELDRTHFSPDPWIYNIERMGFEKADSIIAVSNYTKRILTEHYGIRPEKIRVIHNASRSVRDPLPSRPTAKQAKSAPLVLFLGRLALQKGATHFLDMAARVHALRPEVQFVVAGEGPLLPELVEQSCRLGLQENIVFAGKVSSTEASSLYAKADCFVMPSLSEPFGLVALEAASHGTPVILSRQSGVSEVMSHAFHVDFWNTDKMADCVLTVLREEPLAKQMSLESARGAHALTWERQGHAIRSTYHDLLSSQQ